MKHTKLWTLTCILLSVILTSVYLQPERKVLHFYRKHSDELKMIADGSYDETQLPSFLKDVRVQRWPGEHDVIQSILFPRASFPLPNIMDFSIRKMMSLFLMKTVKRN